MPLTQLAPPYPIFTDKNGDPLDNGYLYFGVVNQNPETTPVQVYYDSALTQPAAQPLRTSNGYIMRNGSPAVLYADTQFSVTIRDKNGSLVIYSPVGYGIDPGSVSGSVIYDDFTGDGVTTVFTLTASPSTKNATNVYIDGVYQSKDNYATNGSTLTLSTAPPLNSAIEVVSQESSIIGGASSQQITYNQGGVGAETRTVQSRLQDFVSVKDFGAVGDGVTDDTAAIQAAIDAARADNGGSVLLPAGSYVCSSTITLKQGVNLVGEGRAHHPIYAGGDKLGSVLLITVGAGQDAFVFESAVKGHFGVYNLSIFEAGSAAFRSIVNITGVLHPVMEDVEVACLNTRRGLGVLIQDDGAGALTLYGSFRNLTAHNVIDGIKILNDCNANSFVGGSINCSRWAIIMDGTTSFPVATSFTGMSFEGMYVAADADVDFFTSPLGIQGWDITQTNGYRFNFLKIIKARTTIFSGCYFELGGYPNPYDDGVNGSHPAIATVAIEPATASDARSTGFYNCRFSGGFLYDSGENTRANNLAGPINYSSEKPSFLSLRRATSQTITAFAWTTIAYTSSPAGDLSIKYDGTTTVTFTQSGTYMVTANIGFAATTATSDYVQARIVCAGTNYVGPNFPKTSASNLETGVTVSALVNVAIGDTLTVQTFNASSSGSMDTAASGANDLYIVKIA